MTPTNSMGWLVLVARTAFLLYAFAPCDGTTFTPPFPVVSIYSTKGKRAEMEDFLFVSRDGRFCVVCDGHGGASVSRYIRENLYSNFLAALPETRPWKDDDVARAFRAAVCKVDSEVCGIRKWQRQGSTCAALHLNCGGGDSNGDGDGDGDGSSGSGSDHERPPSLLITTANVGDSRIVLGRSGKNMDLTTDHKPEHRTEKARILKLGGTITWHGLLRNNRPVRGSGVYRVNRNLSLSRAIGDLAERPCISAEPDIRQYALPLSPATGGRSGTVPGSDEDEPVVILATDGLWDVFTSLEAVAFVQETYRSIKAAALAAETTAVAPSESGSGSGSVSGSGSRHDKTEGPGDEMLLRAKARLLDMGLAPITTAADAADALNKARQHMARCLVAEALRRGSTDNVTVIVQWIGGRRDAVR